MRATNPTTGALGAGHEVGGTDGPPSVSARARAVAQWIDHPRVWTTLVYVAVAVGCLLRLLRFVDNPALWLDEAFLALNLMEKSFGGVLGELDYLQSASPGFLLVEKVAELVLGDGEQSLRLFPLVASLVSIPLFVYVARRVLAAPAAVLAIVLFAVGEPLLERAAEVKPYSVDVAVATLLTALALWVTDAPPGRMVARTAVLGAAALVTLWFSFPAAFSVAAAVLALAAFAWDIGSRRLLTAAALVGAATLVTFGAVYAVASVNIGRVSAAIFAGGRDDPGFGKLGVLQDAWSTVVNPGGFDNGTNALAALLACFGLLAFARRGTLHWLVLFAVPLLLAAAADLLGRYPLGGRFSLFLVPSLLVLVARGAQALVSWSRRPLVVSAGLALFLVASPLAIAAKHALEPPAREDVKPLLERLAREWRPGDTLYVYPNTQYALRYYSTCNDCSLANLDFPWPTRLATSVPAAGHQVAPALESVPPALIVGSSNPDDRISDPERLPRAGRVWLLFSHVRARAGLDEEGLLLSKLTDDELLEQVRSRGARLYLFNRVAPDER